ncbi:MAG: UDP-N-acetylmuramate dehydrogenase [Desulfobacterales bacterium]|jgi:UDP-N-acetylmuramate dehydrogenase
MSLDRDAKNWLHGRFGPNIKFDEPMSKHTYFRIGGPAEAYLLPRSQRDLIEVIVWAGQTQQPYLIIGDGTNLLVKDTGIPGLVIGLRKCLNQISYTYGGAENTLVTAGAGARLQRLCKFAIEAGLAGLNFAIGIPGTVGGGIMMNAGTAEGAMENVLESIEVMLPNGQMAGLEREKLDFRYRALSFKPVMDTNYRKKPIILEGSFKLKKSDARHLQREARALLDSRNKTQPLHYPSAGCFFKNPPAGKTAGELIELAGLKGRRVGDAEISAKHANFIVNSGRATCADVIALMEIVQESVSKLFNIALEPEVKIIGRQE